MQPASIVNPILPGFNPDPSICRVGEDFYIATSTFEWYPGVQIHHSRDLRHWQLIGRPLDRPDLLNLLGVPDSCGVWAPCLSWSNERFWLVYTSVSRFDGNFKDTHNYLTTAADIRGPWTRPVYLNASGFDPSLFHDADGRKWLLNMVWDHRPERDCFGGIVIQEYDAATELLVAEPSQLFAGSGLGCTEGPHVYRFGPFYYLIVAEGGTGYGHAVTIARSRNLHGPYVADPRGPLMTARDCPDWPMQRTGHADVVRLADGSFYLVFLFSRLAGTMRHSPMGRETAIQPVVLDSEGWFRLPFADRLPRIVVRAPELPESCVEPVMQRDDFDSTTLDSVYQWLRTPWPEQFYSLEARPGYLRLFGAESPGSLFRQAMIARRQTHTSFIAETSLEFEAANFQQMAGLILYYNSSKFHYFYVSTDDQIGKHLGIMSCEASSTQTASFPLQHRRISVPGGAPVGLRMTVTHEEVGLEWAAGDSGWKAVPLTLEMRFLTDQAGMDKGEQFTGTFIGICAHDVSGQRAVADFDYFSLKPAT